MVMWLASQQIVNFWLLEWATIVALLFMSLCFIRFQIFTQMGLFTWSAKTRISYESISEIIKFVFLCDMTLFYVCFVPYKLTHWFSKPNASHYLIASKLGNKKTIHLIWYTWLIILIIYSHSEFSNKPLCSA